MEANSTRTITVTVHPNPLSGDLLTVSDALNQVLDLVDALELVESTDIENRQIVWRLTGAYTTSPPFTIEAEPYPVESDQSVYRESGRVVQLFVNEFRALLNGVHSSVIVEDAQIPVARVLDRNLNGIALTDVRIDDDDTLSIEPKSARTAKRIIDQSNFESEVSKSELQHTEFGSVEGEISGLRKWYGKPALALIERLSEKPIVCVLSDELSAEIGPEHRWLEVWESRLVTVTGAFHYNYEGMLIRGNIDSLEEIEWSDVELSDLRDIDILEGRTVTEHLALLRGGLDG